MDDTNIVKSEDANLERERLKSLINSMADGVIAINEELTVVIYNGAALNILDVNSIISGKRIGQVLKLFDKNNLEVSIEQIIQGIKTDYASRDYLIKYQDGSMVKLYISIAPVRLSYGKQGDKGFVLQIRDITREKSLEEERDEFISVASHEIRTPITIAEANISNAKSVVEKSGDITLVKRALNQTYEQIMFLSGLINDLSTLSRAERGKLSMEIDDINAHELINSLAKEYEPQAKAKGLALNLEIDPHLEMLKTSKLYTREVLQNFINNSIKYTQHGSVSIGAKMKNNGILFWVRDTGIGISKSDKEKIFNRFFRSEDYRTRQNNGTGLGLYVTMKLARLLHAQIDVQSELNEGSTFSVFVPNLATQA